MTPRGAVLNGVVDPRGRATSVYFEWGRTREYGRRTAPQRVGAGTTALPVSAQLDRLRSNTRYHFRMVATSSAGTTRGRNRSFRTPRPTTTPSFTPAPAVFPRPVTVSGTLEGTGAASARVTLLARPFPFTEPFAQVGNSVIAGRDGSYAFTLPAALTTSQFRVTATTDPPLASEISTLVVTSQITFRSRRRVRKGRVLVFAGSVAPRQEGRLVLIQRRTHRGGFRTVARTTLRRLSETRSGYRRRITARRSGTYRTVVESDGGAFSPGASPAKSIRVVR